MKRLFKLIIIVTCIFIPSNVFAADIVKDFVKGDYRLNSSSFTIRNIKDSNFMIYMSYFKVFAVFRTSKPYFSVIN